jgi:hypothetical protein
MSNHWQWMTHVFFLHPAGVRALRRGCRALVLLCVLAALVTVRSAVAAEPDWSDYGQLLKKHLSRRTVSGVRLAWVDYSGLRANPAWGRVVGRVAEFPADRLETREERLAFYINAYNILAIKMVLDHWPVRSIKDAGSLFQSVWNKPAGWAAGREITLDGIEHGILRKQGEPRIHMAIVCASLSCADLRPEPYTAERLDEQLDAASAEFLNNPTKGLRVEQGAVRVSRIFAAFEEDFGAAGGVEAFIAKHHPGFPAHLPMRANLPYDWSLNGE